MAQTVDAKSNKKGPKFQSASENLNRIELYNCYIKYDFSKHNKLNVVLINVFTRSKSCNSLQYSTCNNYKIKIVVGNARIVLEYNSLQLHKWFTVLRPYNCNCFNAIQLKSQ